MRASGRWSGVMLLALCLCLPACKKDKPVAWVESSASEVPEDSVPSDDDWLIFGAARHRMHFLRMATTVDTSDPQTHELARLQLKPDIVAELKAELPKVEELYARQRTAIVAKLDAEQAKLFEQEIALEAEIAEKMMPIFWQPRETKVWESSTELATKLEKLKELRAPLSPWLFGLPAKKSEVEEMYDTAYLRKAMKSGYGWPLVNSISRERMEQLEQEAAEKKKR
jgi:hypothetical protein